MSSVLPMCSVELGLGQAAYLISDTHWQLPICGYSNNPHLRHSCLVSQTENTVGYVSSIANPDDSVIFAGDTIDGEHDGHRAKLKATLMPFVAQKLAQQKLYALVGNHDGPDDESILPDLPNFLGATLNTAAGTILVTHGDRLPGIPQLNYPAGIRSHDQRANHHGAKLANAFPLWEIIALKLDPWFSHFVLGGYGENVRQTDSLLRTAKPEKEVVALLQGHLHTPFHQCMLEFEGRKVAHAALGREPGIGRVLKIKQDPERSIVNIERHRVQSGKLLNIEQVFALPY